MFSRKTDERGCVWNQGGTTEATLINFCQPGESQHSLTSEGKYLLSSEKLLVPAANFVGSRERIAWSR